MTWLERSGRPWAPGRATAPSRSQGASPSRESTRTGPPLRRHVHDVDPDHGAVEPGVRVLGRERVELRGELAEDAAPERFHEAALDLARPHGHQDIPGGTRRQLARRGAPRLELHLHARRGHLAGIDTLTGSEAGTQAQATRTLPSLPLRMTAGTSVTPGSSESASPCPRGSRADPPGFFLRIFRDSIRPVTRAAPSAARDDRRLVFRGGSRDEALPACYPSSSRRRTGASLPGNWRHPPRFLSDRCTAWSSQGRCSSNSRC
jgi:hypothetical protein